MTTPRPGFSYYSSKPQPQLTRLERAHKFLAQALLCFAAYNFAFVVVTGLPGHRVVPSLWALLALGPVAFTCPTPRNQQPTSYSDYTESNRRTTWRLPCNDPVRGGD